MGSIIRNNVVYSGGNLVDENLSLESINPVQNKVVTKAINEKMDSKYVATESSTFYVDVTSGSDENDGTEANPFKTIQKAVNSFAPINSLGVSFNIYIKNGVYDEIVSIKDKNVMFSALDSTPNITISSIRVMNNSFLTCYFPLTITRANDNHGIYVINNSSATFSSPLVINGNTNDKNGIYLAMNAVLFSNSSITVNTGNDGIGVNNGSNLYCNNITVNNALNGIHALGSSSITARGSIECTNCENYGIYSYASVVRCQSTNDCSTKTYSGGQILIGANAGVTNGGTVTSKNADYAEISRWSDGNPSNENRIGYFVTVSKTEAGITMTKAVSTSDVRGVTVTAPAFAAGASDDKYNSNGELHQEYDYVVFAGFVNVIDNGSCTVGGRCMPDDNGCAVPSSNNLGYEVIDRVDENTVLVLIEPNGDMIQRIKTDITNIEDGTTPVKKAESASNTTPSEATLKNIKAGTADLVVGSSTLDTGTIYLVYE